MKTRTEKEILWNRLSVERLLILCIFVLACLSPSASAISIDQIKDSCIQQSINLNVPHCTTNLTCQIGPQGLQGLTGPTGPANMTAGPPGTDGTNGSDGAPGYTPLFGVDYFNGSDGAPGTPGYTPLFGVDYFNGSDGAPGTPGYTPVFGVDYFNGSDGAPGYTPVFGVDYFNGSDGAPGIQGIPGLDNMTAGPLGLTNMTMNQTPNQTAGAPGIANMTMNMTSITDHGALTGLTDDDHVRYFDKDGSKAITSSGLLKKDTNDNQIAFSGGSDYTGGGAVVVVYGNAGGGLGSVYIYVPNAAKNALINLMRLTGNTDSPYLNMMGYGVKYVLDPTDAQDAATKNYVDTVNTTMRNNVSLNFVDTQKFTMGSTSTAFGGAITHGMSTIPTSCVISWTNASQVAVISQKTAASIFIVMNGTKTQNKGVTDTISWMCRA